MKLRDCTHGLGNRTLPGFRLNGRALYIRASLKLEILVPASLGILLSETTYYRSAPLGIHFSLCCRPYILYLISDLFYN